MRFAMSAAMTLGKCLMRVRSTSVILTGRAYCTEYFAGSNRTNIPEILHWLARGGSRAARYRTQCATLLGFSGDLLLAETKMPAAILSRPATPERGKGATVQATAIRRGAGITLVVPDK